MGHRLRSTFQQVLLRTAHGRRLWWRRQGVAHELGFWSAWFDGEGGRWAEDYRNRLRPDRPIEDSLVTQRLAELEQESVTILDVGAGPISRLGTIYPGKVIQLVAVDPLADHYDQLLRSAGIVPEGRTVKCHGERLLDRFRPASFDVAFAANAVDHSYDPLQIIRNMLEVVRPDGVVLLRHIRNEGERQQYVGPHQWNFDVEGDHLILWTPTIRHDLTDELRDQARVSAKIESGEVLARLYRGPG
jgi:SAM-dependent methyltransferase